MSNKLAYILIGVAGAGKSTLCEDLKAEYESYGASVSVFSLDACRLAFARTDDARVAFHVAQENYQEFKAFCKEAWDASRDADVVIVDNTNLTKKSRSQWINSLREEGFQIVGVPIIVPAQALLERQAIRGHKAVPLSVINHMLEQLDVENLADEVDIVMEVTCG